MVSTEELVLEQLRTLRDDLADIKQSLRRIEEQMIRESSTPLRRENLLTPDEISDLLSDSK